MRVRACSNKWKISIHALREEGDLLARAPARKGSHFYPRPPRGGRHLHPQDHCTEHDISIHALREEGDSSGSSCLPVPIDFYPRPPRGGRRRSGLSTAPKSHFYPRPPRGGRPFLSVILLYHIFNFYPRPPRGGRPGLGDEWFQENQISIHALREEGDVSSGNTSNGLWAFLSTPSARRATTEARCPRRVFFISIHALREEGDSKNRDKISIFL